MPPVDQPETPARRWGLWGFLLLLILVLVAHGRILAHDLLDWDDYSFLICNPAVSSPSLIQLARAWWEPWGNIYVPLTMNLWMLLAFVAQAIGENSPHGMHPLPFHTASLLIHFLTTVLVWRLILRAGIPPAPALLGAAVFAVHPIQVEAVAWASGLKDLLAACLLIASILCHLQSGDAQRAPVRQRRAWYLLTLLCTYAATCAKPSAVAAPAAALVADWLLAGRPLGKAILRALPLGLAVLPAILKALEVQTAPGVFAGPLLARPFIAAHALGTYIQHYLWPAGYTIDYGLTPLRVFRDSAAFWMPTLAAAALAAVLLAARRDRPILLAGMLLSAGTLGPVLGLVPFEFQRISTVADHYAYPATAGVALIIALLATRYRIAWWTVALLLPVWAGLSVQQAAHWKTSDQLWARALAVRSDSVVALANHANSLIHRAKKIQATQGDTITPEVAELYRAARPYVTATGRLVPDSRVLLRMSAECELAIGTAARAAVYEERSLRMAIFFGEEPRTIADDATLLAQRYLQLGQNELARRQLRLALQYRPDKPSARQLLEELESSTRRTNGDE